MPVRVKLRVDFLVCGLQGDLLWHLSMSTPCFHGNKCHEAMKNCQDSAFSLCGLEVGLPAFQLPMFAKCDALPKKGLCMFMQHVCQRESMPFVNMEGSNSYQMLEVAESGSTLHQFEVSCLQKIESRYPRFGLQDIDCDLGCLIYETAASQWRIVEIQLLASVGWKRVCEPFGSRC